MSEEKDSKNSPLYLIPRNFSRVYVEEGAVDFDLTRRVLTRLSRAKVVRIANYKDLFARPRQNWGLQKRSMSLVLAVKRDGFLYRGSELAPNFDHQNFFYNSPILNCLYDCSYCYLQGLYPSAHVVIFVNQMEFFRHTDEALALHDSIYLCLSYDTDLLAFEEIVPLCAEWLAFAAARPTLQIEIRTKSAAYRAIRHLAPIENAVLAWTLSPDSVARTEERRAPSLTARLASAKSAIRDGWRVRLCFDPVLHVPDWEKIYPPFIEEVFQELDPAKICDVTIGVFRMNWEFLKLARKRREDTPILHQHYGKEGKVATYGTAEREQLLSSVQRAVHKYLPQERVVVAG